jgi:hypothetical protein
MQQNFVEETAASIFFHGAGGSSSSRFVRNVVLYFALRVPFGFILQRHMINGLKP